MLCWLRGYQILKSNWHLTWAEIDLFVRDRSGRLLLIEVRGRTSQIFRPVEMVSEKKRRRLLRAASYLSRRYRAPVRVLLLELQGDSWLPRKARWYYLE